MSTDSSHSQHSGANTPWTPPSPEELGTRLPAYEVTEILGRGGMGAVYKARQKSLKRWVAIKLLPLVAADDELKFAERFRNEAETMAQMNHPSIVNVYDFGETSDGLLYIVMEFVDGTDVQKMIHGSGLLSGDYALAITAHVCDALAYAHARGVIHRDIKPANILIDQEGNVKVADFGLAKMTDIDYGLTQSNVAMGTPDYVAPEVLSYGMVADHRADLYAIGVMLYQMLTGEVPRGLFKMPSQKGIGADPRFDDIICKAMEPDRDERYQSASDVRQALDVILTTALPKEDVPPKVVAKGARQKENKQGAGKTVRPPVKKTSSVGTMVAIGVVVTALVVTGFLVLGHQSKSVPANGSKNAAPGKSQPLVKAREITGTGKVDAGVVVPGNKEVSKQESWTDWLATETWKEPWVFQNDTLKPTAKNQGRILGNNGDGSVRMRFRNDAASRMQGSNPPLQIMVRSTVDNVSADPRGTYQFQLDPFQGSSNLLYLSKDPRDGSSLPPIILWEGKKFPMTGNESELEFRAEGTELSLLSGGVLIAGIKDDRLAAGSWAIAVSPGIVVTGLETRFPNADTGETLSEPTIDWIKALPGESSPWSSEWNLKDGVLAPSTKLRKQFGLMKDGSVRLRVRLASDPPEAGAYGPQLQLTIRSGSLAGTSGRTGHMQFQTYVPSRAASLHFQEKTKPDLPVEKVLADKAQRISELDSREVEWEFRAVGDEYSAWADGQLVGTVRDARIASGYCLLDVGPGIEITRLETTGLTPTKPGPSPATVTASPASPPNITQWLDVTETLRETARGTSGLSVENDGTIRHTPEGRFPKVTLTKPDQRDNAVRVHYTGEVQIGLRSNTKNTDFLFVLCEANQTIFAKFHGDKAEKSEKVGLTKTHPSVFEADREHELLVTMQGTRFRAWMDGVFWGEGNDDTLTEGTTVLLFTPKMVVKKVEIAELAASPADAAASVRTFQGHRYQFVPGSYTWTEAKSEAEELGGHLAVITSAEEDEWVWKTFSGPRPQVPKEELWMHGWWLGASQSPQEKAWQWLTAEAMAFTGWRPGEPRATIQPPRGLWMSDDANDALDSKWTAQKMSWKGGFLVEWESSVAAQTVAVAAPWTDRLGTMTWETPWSLKDGALSTSAPVTMQELGQVGDGALRIRARLAAGTDKGQLKGPTLQPALRIGPVNGATDRQGSYQFQAYFPGGACSLVYLERDLKTGTDLPPEYLWKNSALPPDLRGKEEIEWEFRAVGDELSAWADGQFVASARDARVSSGRSKLTAFPGIEITSVETSGIKANTPAAANQIDPPKITNWQDVTGSVRETAQSIPQLVVESGHIRHVGQGTSPRIQLSPDGLRDYAVRLHFTGESQVNLRRDDYGFIYVLCQRSKTIFQRYDKAEPDPIVLIPTVLHPPGYDSTQPHELLVTMERSTIRTWLDGRFLGEAHDDTLANGCADIAFTKYCTVQKVEIAELAVK